MRHKSSMGLSLAIAMTFIGVTCSNITFYYGDDIVNTVYDDSMSILDMEVCSTNVGNLTEYVQTDEISGC